MSDSYRDAAERTDSQFNWLFSGARFADTDLEKVFAKVGRKVRRGGLRGRTDVEVWKYTTSCLLSREAEQKATTGRIIEADFMASAG